MMTGTSCFTIRPKPQPAPKNRKRTHHEIGVTGFQCIDGEGITLPSGEHRYVLLGCGQDQIEDSSGLRFADDILPFLYERSRKGIANAGFYLGYDFTQWFSTLPSDRAAMLLTRRGIASRKHKRPGIPPHPVEYAGWQFDLLGNKRLRIRPKLCDCRIVSCKCDHAAWMYVCDTGGYFQTSFLNVINPSKWPEPIVSEDEYAAILEGKKRRSSAELDDDMRYYNRLENEILARVLGKVDEGFRGNGVILPPAKWFGPGQAAQAWMKGRAPKRVDIIESVPEWFLEAARLSYFGGWFEIMMHGMIPGVTHEYDINSAYPYIISSLPCLLHGTYEQGTGNPGNVSNGDRLTLVRACVHTQSYAERRKRHYVGAMLHRDHKGRISRPLITEGWYWLDELQAARRAGCITGIEYLEWCSYLPCNCAAPLRDVSNLYLSRLAVGKDTPMGKGAKLVYNSEYGKFAQSVGEPVYGNAVYASRITSGCRTQILNAIASHPKGKSNVAMVATDAVYFLNRHPTLQLGEGLGDWSHSERHNITLFKPGVYWDDKTRAQVAEGETPTFKARGINAADLGSSLGRIDAEFRGWGSIPPDFTTSLGDRNGAWPSVTFRPAFSMTTALQALMQNDWSRAGTISFDVELKQSSDPSSKRYGVWYDQDASVYRSEPKWFGEGCSVVDARSTGYERRFGMDDPWSEESLSANGINFDGYVGEEFRFITGKDF